MRDFGGSKMAIHINPETESIIDQNIDYYRNYTNSFDVVFEYNQYNSYANLCKFFNLIKNNLDNVQNCHFYIRIDSKFFTKKDINILKIFNQLLENYNCKLEFKELNVVWDSNEFFKTYQALDDICSKVQNLDLSPMEQLMCFYYESTKRIYKEEEKSESSVISRSIVGINNTDRIVCSGYADWLVSMCKYINNPNIKCISFPINFFKNNKYESSHKVNLVYIKDEKYKVDGLYYVDTCWDSKKDIDFAMQISHCLIPIRDLLFTRNFKLKPIFGNEFTYLLSDKKPTSTLLLDNRQSLRGIKKLDLFDIKQMRENFAKRILEQAQKYSLSKSNEYLEQLKNSLNPNEPFRNPDFEYTFLRYLCNKIKASSKPIEISVYSDALQIMATKYLGLNEIDAKKYIEEVISFSKTKSFNEFTTGAQNSIYLYAKIEHDRREEHIRQIKQHRQELRDKKQRERLKKQDQEQTKE